MKTRVTPLPHWVLTDLQPAFYDTESGSVLSLLAKIYGKINEVIDEVNFQDREIADAIGYMKTNLTATVQELFEEGLEAGTFHSEFSLTYDENTETITILDVLSGTEDV